MMKLVTDSPSKVRVLIAESAELVRRGLRDVLTADGDISVVGETAWHRDAVRACSELIPDIIVLGLSRSQGGRDGMSDGLAALEQVISTNPQSLVIALVDGSDVEDLLLAVRSGARAVLLRDTPAESLRQAIRDVLNGDCALDAHLTDLLFKRIVSGPGQFETAVSGLNHSPSVRPPLSPRESEVLYWMTEGLGNKQIAARMGVTPGTVKTHISHIFTKLHVNDRISAVLAGMRLAAKGEQGSVPERREHARTALVS